MTLAEQIVAAAKTHGISIATAESCTGGVVAASLTDVPGSSAAFECGFVTYSNAAKQKMLGVLPETLDAHGAVSEPVALEMAQGAIDASQATLSVAITGIAGPGASDHKPEGRVCFAIAQSGLNATSQTIEFGALGRAQVRAAAREHAKHLLLAAMTP